MHPVIPYSIFFLALGAAGMAYGSRHASVKEKRMRWLKYFTYILFTSIVLAGIFYHYFTVLAIFILFAGLVELLRTSFLHDRNNATGSGGRTINESISAGYAARPGNLQVIAVMVIYAFLAFLFMGFASLIPVELQVYIFFQVLVFDGFCQISGQIFGRRPLAPAISPAKTWEGLAGGWIFCMITAWLTAGWIPYSAGKALLTGAITGVSAFSGDMMASWYKRRSGIKDYSNWLPGQGGFLDRYDSFIVAGGLCFLLQSIAQFYF